MNIHYTKHGRYGVAIIQAPKLFGKRLGYLSMENDSSWALRDYIGGVMLRCGDSPTIKLSDIEAVVEKYWPAPYRSVDRRQEWTDDLETRSKNIFPTSYDGSTPPSTSWGPWRPLP
jgi:hypothetical protein